MLQLTRQQRQVVAVFLMLLVVGWMVKAWRTSNPHQAAALGEPTSHGEAEFRGNR
ncbi:MAG: hypothetical protein AB7O66_13490 [Limisphaerales bacterium]